MPTPSNAMYRWLNSAALSRTNRWPPVYVEGNEVLEGVEGTAGEERGFGKRYEAARVRDLETEGEDGERRCGGGWGEGVRA